MNIKVVTNDAGCPNCRAAKSAMNLYTIEYEAVDAHSEEGQALLTSAGVRTIPVFFDGTTYLGDYRWFLSGGMKSLQP